MFLWFLVSIIIDDIVLFYANIWTKEGTMQSKVLKINIILTFDIVENLRIFEFLE